MIVWGPRRATDGEVYVLRVMEIPLFSGHGGLQIKDKWSEFCDILKMISD